MKNSPCITLKCAQSLDGCIATRTGDSKWISSIESRKYVHSLRNKHDAILVGINTVLFDDPKLNVRLVKGKNPIRIILDTHLKISKNSKIIKNKENIRTIIVTSKNKIPKRLISHNIEILKVNKNSKGRINLKEVLIKLYKLGIKSILVEGGSTVFTEFLRLKLVDKLVVIIAPIIIGSDGKSMVQSLDIKRIKDVYKLNLNKVIKKSNDIILIYN